VRPPTPGDVGGHRVAEEQAALRRVATLVAQAASPEDVFAAVASETGRILEAGFTNLSRYEPDGAFTIVAAWSDGTPAFPVGSRLPLGGRNVHTLVFERGQAARLDDYVDATGPASDMAHEYGLRQTVGVPVSVEGRLWGAIVVACTGDRDPLPADTATRLAGFTELTATAIANAQARTELRVFADEQAALRRVATLVARAAPPEEVFATVAAETGRLFSAEVVLMSRYDPDGAATIVGAWRNASVAEAPAVGSRIVLGGRDLHTLVYQTGAPARMEDYQNASPWAAGVARIADTDCAAGAPVGVDGKLWGLIGLTGHELPPGTEVRLGGFAGLVATAIANSEARAALSVSRARLVTASDAARRRIERDLHDGAQQRLVSLALRLRAAQAVLPPDAVEVAGQLEDAVAEVNGVLEDLSEIARGLHPATLTRAGLLPALQVLARRCAIPVGLEVEVRDRPPEAVEIAAYYTVSEALTNAVKYAQASAVAVKVAVRDGVLRATVRDDGRGGAHFGRGSGLVGLKDRIEALGGQFFLHSPSAVGTTVEIALPLSGPSGMDSPAVGSLACLQEPEDREHPAVLVLALRQVELHEDAADVLLDRALGDEDPVRDPRVGRALGHQGQHLALARRQDVERVVAAAGQDELLHQGRIHHRGAGGDAPDRVYEVRDVGDPALQQVADALAARQQVHRLGHLDVRGQDDDRGGGQFLADHPGRLEALGGMPRRHADVDNRQVGLDGPDEREQPGAVPRLARDLVPGTGEQAGQALSQEDIVVGEHGPRRTRDLGHGAAHPG
jgi:signal transduction histidine kinase